MVEDSEVAEEGDGDLVSEEVLLPGLMLVWEEEAYQGVVIFLVELRECLQRLVTFLMVIPGMCLIMEKWLIRGETYHIVMPGRLWEQIPILRR
jgi:hypothetical protein